jgi:hypothetical protein
MHISICTCRFFEGNNSLSTVIADSHADVFGRIFSPNIRARRQQATAGSSTIKCSEMGIRQVDALLCQNRSGNT